MSVIRKNKPMKNYYCLLLYLMIIPAAYSQPDSSRIINFYYNTFFLEEFSTSTYLSSDSYPTQYYLHNYKFNANHAISVGIQWQNRKNHIFELEWMPFRYAHQDVHSYQILLDSLSYQGTNAGGSKYQIYHSFIRFSYLPVYRIGNVILLPKLSVKPYYYYMCVNPFTAREFFTAKWQAGIMLEFIPGLQYSINKKLGMQIGIPLTLVSFGYERGRTDHPALSLNRRISDRIFLRSVDPLWQFQVGLAYKI